ncbi:MAG: primase-helicase zinc-binding domain-containing protein [Alphaproteobacteria bacterium]|jgi:hypothetical protein|nr:primase-helicase zinc-binding domain-containing protein [Alphaproteobacteria bacterium]
MNAQTINQTFDLLSLAQRETELKHSGKYYIGPCPFCGGDDRFNLKQTDHGWLWICRDPKKNCPSNANGKYKSPIDYIMTRDRVDFKEALEILGGSSPYTASGPRREITAAAKPEIILPDSDWQAQRLNEITTASDALLANKPARAYLESRALDPSMWNVFSLGFALIYKRPAIVIPWMDEEETITAIKYRFIDDRAKDKSQRYTMAKGSKQILFGLSFAGLSETLILVEGEFNSISIAQVSAAEGFGIDALSFGSDTTTHADILRIVASDYRRVIVWADNPDIANDIRSSLARPAGAICSPEIDGIKYDANAMLQKGFLAGFLHQTIKDTP